MAKRKISIEKTISDLKELFYIQDNKHGSIENNGKFYIQKSQLHRFQVIEILQSYFSDKYIDDGFCSVCAITMGFTDFEIIKGTPTL